MIMLTCFKQIINVKQTNRYEQGKKHYQTLHRRCK